MPAIKSVVVFEENPEEIEGHFFYLAGEEHRVIRLDAIDFFPSRWSSPTSL